MYIKLFIYLIKKVLYSTTLKCMCVTYTHSYSLVSQTTDQTSLQLLQLYRINKTFCTTLHLHSFLTRKLNVHIYRPNQHFLACWFSLFYFQTKPIYQYLFLTLLIEESYEFQIVKLIESMQSNHTFLESLRCLSM